MQRTFATPTPVGFSVQLPAGEIVITTTDAATSVISVDGPRAEVFTVGQQGRSLTLAPPAHRLFQDLEPHLVRVSLPRGSSVAARLAQTQLQLIGTFTNVRAQSTSGDITVAAVTEAAAVTSESGMISIAAASGSAMLRSESGPIEVETMSGVLRVRSRDGDLRVAQLLHGVVTAHTVTGSIRVGVPAGMPAWTDVASTLGDVVNAAAKVGPPQAQQEFVELYARTHSGRIVIFGADPVRPQP